MDNHDLEKWIRESAEYIREKQVRDDYFAGSTLDDGQGITKREEIIERLKKAKKLADKLEKALKPLYREIAFDGLPADFSLTQMYLQGLYENTLLTNARLRMALQQGVPPGKTKKMEYHQSAVRLAAACFAEPNPKETKAIAVRIIQEAGLSDDYSERALEEWWQTVKKDFWKD